MPTNPYAPPTADVSDEPSLPAQEFPAEVQKKIKNAWVAGIVSGCMTLLLTLLAISGTKTFELNEWSLIDVALIFGLTFGIYRKSRVSAVTMLLYFVISKIIITVETGKFSGSILAIVFLYFYAQGVAGTFAYHRLLKTSNRMQDRS